MLSNMILPFAIAFPFLSSLVLGSATIEFCNTGSCDGSCSTQTVDSDGGECRQLGGIDSAKTLNLDDGCSVTVYTDSNCSNNAATAGLNSCVAETEVGLNSYSYDC